MNKNKPHQAFKNNCVTQWNAFRAFMNDSRSWTHSQHSWIVNAAEFITTFLNNFGSSGIHSYYLGITRAVQKNYSLHSWTEHEDNLEYSANVRKHAHAHSNTHPHKNTHTHKPRIHKYTHRETHQYIVHSKAQTNVLLALTNVLFLKANILEGSSNILFPVVYMNRTKLRFKYHQYLPHKPIARDIAK